MLFGNWQIRASVPEIFNGYPNWFLMAKSFEVQFQKQNVLFSGTRETITISLAFSEISVEILVHLSLFNHFFLTCFSFFEALQNFTRIVYCFNAKTSRRNIQTCLLFPEIWLTKTLWFNK